MVIRLRAIDMTLPVGPGHGQPNPAGGGGDKRSRRFEAYASAILTAVDQKPDIPLGRIPETLLSGKGRRWRSSDAVALLGAPRDHPEKRSGNTADRQRSDVLARRRSSSEGTESRPERLIFSK